MSKFKSSGLAVLAFMATLPASATLTPTIQRGERLVQIPVQGASNEICVIPTHLPQADYSKRDLKREDALCRLVRGENAATCPKLVSTNPGVEFYAMTPGLKVDDVEAKGCVGLKKAAKYKQSVSCSYTPSILGYYHVSRLLDGAGNVPPAVVRTFDLNRHKIIAKRGMALAAAKSGTSALIYQTWSSLASALNAGAASKKKDILFTDAIDQTYGALQWNPKKEEKYSALFNKAAPGETRAKAFRNGNAIFAKVRNSKPVTDFVGRAFTAANVQDMQVMKDVSDMVLLDTLLSQEDRFGNIHFLNEYAYRDVNDLGKDGLPKVKLDDELTPEVKALGAVPVKVMILKDNDCGVNRVNHAADADLLGRVAHMDPKTYKGLLKLNATADSAEVVTAFKRGMMFSASDWDKFRANVKSASASLKQRCQAGTLKLDLDLDAHFANTSIPQQSCEL